MISAWLKLLDGIYAPANVSYFDSPRPSKIAWSGGDKTVNVVLGLTVVTARSTWEPAGL